MQQGMRAGLIMAIATLAGGCGTLIDGDGARLDHWGPIPVLCLGQCSALDPYYYDKQQAAGEDDPVNQEATTTTAETDEQAP